MYLKSIHLQHTGPVSRVNIELPFEGDRPKPVVLVGPNGSGKSTVVSFIVNALVAFKQHAFDESEIEKGRVYRVRSPLGIQSDANYYYAHLAFEKGLHLREWQLDRTRKAFETDLGWTPIDSTWNQIPEHETSHFAPDFGTVNQPHQLEEVFSTNCVLFFPADRFEPPDWLNTENLSSELKLPEPSRMKGKSPRRIFSRNRLKPTMEWLASVVLDMLLHEQQQLRLPIQNANPGSLQYIEARVPVPGRSTVVFNSIASILREIIAEEPGDQVQLSIGDRRSRIVSANILRNGAHVRTIKDLLSLSAGESALFCMFAAIIRDADQAGMQFKTPEEIRGLVVIDEADLHLHLGLQHKVFPKLLALFPQIQFIMTVHSPLVVLGMDSTFGSEGFLVLDMPSAQQISPESYSEFKKAFDIFAKTRTFGTQLLAHVNAQPKPVILVEGTSDETLIRTAWEKLNPSMPIPYELITCGVDPNPDARTGGAEMLRRCLEFLAIASDKTIIALFDNDRKGSEQFAGVNKKAFDAGVDFDHKKHKTKTAHAILLPVPLGREIFVTPGDMGQRYLAIEHYFSDSLLANHGMKGAAILGTTVFEIIGDKVKFAKGAATFDAQEFRNFTGLFSRIHTLI